MAAQMADEKDIEIIKEAILFPYILNTLEHDIRLLMDSNLKMKELYARQLRGLQNKATLVNSDIRKQMRNRGIKILTETREKERFVTEYLVRGYTSNFQMLYTHLKVNIQARLAGLMNVDLGDKTTDP